MRHPRRSSNASSLLLSALVAGPLAAQGVAGTPMVQPTIEVRGVGEAKVTPDRAMISISVQNKARTAALAGAENARKATAIIDAIRGAGVAREQLGTSDYTVAPSYRYYPDGRKPELTGYDASNTVRVDVRSLDLVGKVIDAALAAGATTISGMSFYASMFDATRREALASATSDARLSAEAMAKALGGTLGTMISVTSQMRDQPQPMQVMAMQAMRGKAADDQETPVVAPTEQTVSAQVIGRWMFIAGGAR
jgi:uncharacterized protein